MKTTLTLQVLLLTLAAGLPGAAQAAKAGDDLVVASAGLAIAQGDAQDLTNKLAGGYAFELGYQFHPEGFGPSLMAYAGWQRLPAGASTAARPTYSLAGPDFGLDLVYRPWDQLPLVVATGPSAHIWQVQQQSASAGTLGDQGLKLGWRLGVSYLIDTRWSVDLKYTATEWRSDGGATLPPIKPAFLTFMATYRF